MRVTFLSLSLFLLIPASIQLKCDDLTDEDFMDWNVILRNCSKSTALKYNGFDQGNYKTLFAGDVRTEDLWPIFEVIESIKGIHLDFSRSGITDIVLYKLTEFEGNLIAESCSNLERIFLRSIKTLKSLFVVDNPRLESIEVNHLKDSLVAFEGDLVISGNSRLENLMFNFSYIYAEFVDISFNDNLKTAEINADKEIEFKTFLLHSNRNLQTMQLNASGFTWSDYELEEDCKNLNNTLLLQKPECANFIVRNNPVLGAFEFKKGGTAVNKAEDLKGKPIFDIRNNPRIRNEFYNDMVTVIGENVGLLETGDDCFLTAPVHHLKEIRRCKNIRTDLHFMKGAEGSWPQKIADVDGCLNMNDTKLHSLSGLQNANIYCRKENVIVNNYHVSDLDNKTRFGNLKEDSNGGVMCSCLKDLFDLKKHKNCTYFMGDLKIHKLAVKKGIVVDDEMDYGPVEKFSKLTKEIGQRLTFVWGSLEVSFSRVPELWPAFASLRSVVHLGSNTTRGIGNFSIKIVNSTLPRQKDDDALKNFQSIISEDTENRVQISANRPKSEQEVLIEKLRDVAPLDTTRKTIFTLESTKAKSSKTTKTTTPSSPSNSSSKRAKRSAEEEGKIEIIWLPEYDIDESSIDWLEEKPYSLISTIVKYSIPVIAALTVASIVSLVVFYVSEEKPRN